MKDTRTPVLVSFWTLLVNAGFGLLLMQFMGHAGLALALTLASIFNAVVLLVLLSRRLGSLDLSSIFKVVVRMIPALLAMAIVVNLLLTRVEWLLPGEFLPRLAVLVAAVACGGLVYLIGLWLSGVKEMRQAWDFVTEKIASRRSRKADTE